MSRYSIERREWVLRQMMPPGNRSVSDLAEEMGISAVTLYAWRKQARAAGAVVPGDGKSPDGWSNQEQSRASRKARTNDQPPDRRKTMALVDEGVAPSNTLSNEERSATSRGDRGAILGYRPVVSAGDQTAAWPAHRVLLCLFRDHLVLKKAGVAVQTQTRENGHQINTIQYVMETNGSRVGALLFCGISSWVRV